MTKTKRLPKIIAYNGSGGNGFGWDNGDIAFGDPFDLIFKREKVQENQVEYRNMYKKLNIKKCRKKMLQKNETLK